VIVGAHGILIVYDVTDKFSLSGIDNWMAEVERFASESTIKLLVGNKTDLEDKRQVTYQEGKEFTARYDMQFLETSAKNASNVAGSFQFLCKEIKRMKKATIHKEIKTKIVPKKSSIP
jgi:Ras-related protein Rab-1A